MTDYHYQLPARVIAMCKHRRWPLGWTVRGVYLHLEVSELIEAIRGKGGDPLKEAADVVVALMAITESNGLDWKSVLEQADRTVQELMTRPLYPGEYRAGE